MKNLKSSKNKPWMRLITFTVITALLCQNIVWAYPELPQSNSLQVNSAFDEDPKNNAGVQAEMKGYYYKLKGGRGNSTRGAMKQIGKYTGHDKEIIDKARKKEPLWLDMVKKLRVETRRIKDINVTAKFIEDDKNLPKELSAYRFYENITDETGRQRTNLVIVTRKDYREEAIYHEAREEFWQEKLTSETDELLESEQEGIRHKAHILASAEQSLAFAGENSLTPFHENQIKTFSAAQLKSLLAENNLCGRSLHHTLVERKLGKPKFKKYLEYEKLLRLKALLELLERKTEINNLFLRTKKSRTMLEKALKSLSEKEKRKLCEKVTLIIKRRIIEYCEVKKTLLRWFNRQQMAEALGTSMPEIDEHTKTGDLVSYVTIGNIKIFHPLNVISEYLTYKKDKSRIVAEKYLKSGIESLTKTQFIELIKFVREETGKQIKINEQCNITDKTINYIYSICRRWETIYSLSKRLGISIIRCRKILNKLKLKSFSLRPLRGTRNTLVPPFSVEAIEKEIRLFLDDTQKWCKTACGVKLKISSIKEFMSSWVKLSDLAGIFPFAGAYAFCESSGINKYVVLKGPLVKPAHYIPPFEVERLKGEVIGWITDPHVFKMLKKYKLLPEESKAKELTYEDAADIILKIKATWLTIYKCAKKSGFSLIVIQNHVQSGNIDGVKLGMFRKDGIYFIPPSALNDFKNRDEHELNRAIQFLEETCGVEVTSLGDVRTLLAQHCLTSSEIAERLGIRKIDHPGRFPNTIVLNFTGAASLVTYWKKETAEDFIKEEKRKFRELKKTVSLYSDISGITTPRKLIELLDKKWKSPNEISTELGISYSAVMKAVYSGGLPFVTINLTGYKKRVYIYPGGKKRALKNIACGPADEDSHAEYNEQLERQFDALKKIYNENVLNDVRVNKLSELYLLCGRDYVPDKGEDRFMNEDEVDLALLFGGYINEKQFKDIRVLRETIRKDEKLQLAELTMNRKERTKNARIGIFFVPPATKTQLFWCVEKGENARYLAAHYNKDGKRIYSSLPLALSKPSLTIGITKHELEHILYGKHDESIDKVINNIAKKDAISLFITALREIKTVKKKFAEKGFDFKNNVSYFSGISKLALEYVKDYNKLHRIFSQMIRLKCFESEDQYNKTRLLVTEGKKDLILLTDVIKNRRFTAKEENLVPAPAPAPVHPPASAEKEKKHPLYAKAQELINKLSIEDKNVISDLVFKFIDKYLEFKEPVNYAVTDMELYYLKKGNASYLNARLLLLPEHKRGIYLSQIQKYYEIISGENLPDNKCITIFEIFAELVMSSPKKSFKSFMLFPAAALAAGSTDTGTPLPALGALLGGIVIGVWIIKQIRYGLDLWKRGPRYDLLESFAPPLKEKPKKPTIYTEYKYKKITGKKIDNICRGIRLSNDAEKSRNEKERIRNLSSIKDNARRYMLYYNSGNDNIFAGIVTVKKNRYKMLYKVFSVNVEWVHRKGKRQLPEEFVMNELAERNPKGIVFHKNDINTEIMDRLLPDHAPADKNESTMRLKEKIFSKVTADDEAECIFFVIDKQDFKETRRLFFGSFNFSSLWKWVGIRRWIHSFANGLFYAFAFSSIFAFAEVKGVITTYTFFIEYVGLLLSIVVVPLAGRSIAKIIRRRADPARSRHEVGESENIYPSAIQNMRMGWKMINKFRLFGYLRIGSSALSILLIPAIGVFFGIVSPYAYLTLMFIRFVSDNVIYEYEHFYGKEVADAGIRFNKFAQKEGYSENFTNIDSFSEMFRNLIYLCSLLIGWGIYTCGIPADVSAVIAVLAAIAIPASSFLVPYKGRDYKNSLNTKVEGFTENSDGSVILADGVTIMTNPDNPLVIRPGPKTRNRRIYILPWVEQLGVTIKCEKGHKPDIKIKNPKRLSGRFKAKKGICVLKWPKDNLTIELVSREEPVIFGESIVIEDTPDHNGWFIKFYPKPKIRREKHIALLRAKVIYAESKDKQKLLKANNADALLVSSGKYLVKSEAAHNDLALVRAILHEDIEALMQIIAKKDSSKYSAIKELIMPLNEVREKYKNLFPAKKEPYIPADLILNDIIAKAVELIYLLEEGILSENKLTPQEIEFVNSVKPIIIFNRHGYFSREFWDSGIRGEKIRNALNEGMCFYQTANSDNRKPEDKQQGPDMLTELAGRTKSVNRRNVAEVRRFYEVNYPISIDAVYDLRDKGFFVPAGINELINIFEGLNIPHGLRFIDLGSGDGRVVAMAGIYNLKAIGIEYDPDLFITSTHIKQNVLSKYIDTDNIRFINGDFMHKDLDEGKLNKYDIAFYQNAGTNTEEELKQKVMNELRDDAIFIAYGHIGKEWMPGWVSFGMDNFRVFSRSEENPLYIKIKENFRKYMVLKVYEIGKIDKVKSAKAIVNGEDIFFMMGMIKGNIFDIGIERGIVSHSRNNEAAVKLLLRLMVELPKDVKFIQGKNSKEIAELYNNYLNGVVLEDKKDGEVSYKIDITANKNLLDAIEKNEGIFAKYSIESIPWDRLQDILKEWDKSGYGKNPPKGAPAELLSWMHKNKIFIDNPKKSKEMAGQRSGKNDSWSTIKRELKVLRAVGLVKGDGRNGYYLPDWLKDIDPKDIIKEVPELNIAGFFEKFKSEQIEAVRLNVLHANIRSKIKDSQGEAFIWIMINIYEIKKSCPDIFSERLMEELRSRCRDVPDEIYKNIESAIGFLDIIDDLKGNIIIPFESEISDTLVRIGIEGTLTEDSKLDPDTQLITKDHIDRYIIQSFRTKVLSIEKHYELDDGGKKVIKRKRNDRDGSFELSISYFDKDGSKINEYNFKLGLNMPISEQIAEINRIAELRDVDTYVILYDILYFIDNEHYQEKSRVEVTDLFLKIGKSLLEAVDKIQEYNFQQGLALLRLLNNLRCHNYPPSLKDNIENVSINLCRKFFDEVLKEAKPKQEYESSHDIQRQYMLMELIKGCSDIRTVPLFIDILKADIPTFNGEHPFTSPLGMVNGEIAFIPLYKIFWMEMKQNVIFALENMVKSMKKEERDKIVEEILQLFKKALEKCSEEISYFLLFPYLVHAMGIMGETRAVPLIVKALEMECAVREPGVELKYPGASAPAALAEIGSKLNKPGDTEEKARIADILINIFNDPKFKNNYSLRLECIEGLGILGSLDKVEMLHEMANAPSTNPYFRKAAIDAIGGIANHNSIYTLINLLNKADELDEVDLNLKGCILDALGPLRDKIDILKQHKPMEIINNIADILGGENEMLKGKINECLKNLGFSDNKIDEFERLYFLYEIWEKADEISSELFIERFPDLRQIVGDKCLILIGPLFMEIFGKRDNGRPRMTNVFYNRFKNRLRSAKSEKAVFNMDSMKKELDECGRNDKLMRSMFAELIRRGNVKSRVWEINKEFFDNLEKSKIDYQKLFNLNDCNKVEIVFRRALEKLEIKAKNKLSVSLADVTGYSLNEFLGNNELFKIYADEVAEVLGKLKNIGDSESGINLSELYFTRGNGIEFRIAGRTREDLILGKKCGDCTAPEGHAFWSVASYLAHPGYHTLLAFYNGALIDKLDLVVYKDEDTNEPVMVIDAHEPVPQTEEGKSASEDFIKIREEVVKKSMEKAVEITERSGFRRIYGAGISGRKFLEDYYDKYFTRQKGLMRLIFDINPLDLFIKSNGVVFGEEPEIFLQSTSKGSFPRDVETALTDIERIISDYLGGYETHSLRYALIWKNPYEIAGIIRGKEYHALADILKGPIEILNLYGIPLEYAMEIIYGASPVKAPARLFIIKENGTTAKEIPEKDLKKIWLYDRAQRILDDIKKAKQEAERIEIFLKRLVPLAMDTAIGEGDKMLGGIMTEGAGLIDEEIGRLFIYLNNLSKVFHSLVYSTVFSINMLFMKKGYYFALGHIFGKIIRIITLKGKEKEIRVLIARPFGKTGSFFSDRIGMPIIQNVFHMDDRKRRIDFRRAVIEETQHYFDMEENIPLWKKEAKAALANLAVGPEPYEYLIDIARNCVNKMRITIHDYYKEPLVFDDEHTRGYFYILLLLFLQTEFFEPFEIKTDENPDWWQGEPKYKVSISPKEFYDRCLKIFDLRKKGELTDDKVLEFAKMVFKKYFDEEIDPRWFEEISSAPFSQAQLSLPEPEQPEEEVKDNKNVTCGTICESGHEGSYEALDSQLERQFEELKRLLRSARNDSDSGDLTEDESDMAMVEYAKRFDIEITFEQLQEYRKQIKDVIASEKSDEAIRQINIFFSIPETGTELFRVKDDYAGGHYNRAGTRIHISLPIILKRGIQAGIDIAKHDLAHIQGKGHQDDEGMKLVREIAKETVDEVAIGNVSLLVTNPENPWNVPVTDLPDTQENLEHLQWMFKKDLLGQDMFLIGPPGPERRNLAMRFAELTKREVEYIALSGDTTEFDLKQRREKIAGSTKFFDEAAVRAAIYGRLLILDNVQYAERNVLPTLNNLLENREINLEDGRRIVSSIKYDKLLEGQTEEELNRRGIIRAHPEFRVIALGTPNIGNPLDPPFRSRFQGRVIGYPVDLDDLLRFYSPDPDKKLIRNLIAFSFVTREVNKDPGLRNKVPVLSANGLIRIAALIKEFPDIPVQEAIKRVYPIQGVSEKLFTITLKQYGLWERKLFGKRSISIDKKPDELIIEINGRIFAKKLGSDNILVPSVDFTETEDSRGYFQDMAEDYILDRDMLIIGNKGAGKTMQALYFAQSLGLEVEIFPLYKDITSRDLLQRRITKPPDGDTGWQNTPLIEAALYGRIVILDGIHQLKPNILSVLHRLLQDRELDLPDGARIVSQRRYRHLLTLMNEEELNDKKIFPVHPDFRVIALGETPSKENRWLTQEIIELFSMHIMKYPSEDSERSILLKSAPEKSAARLQKLGRMIREGKLSINLSLRQLIHIAKHLARYGEDTISGAFQKATLMQFLPEDEISALRNIIETCGFKIKQGTEEKEVAIEIAEKDRRKILKMDDLACELTEPENPALVPDPSPFYDVPEHKKHLKSMFEDYLLGQDIDMLLIGMQGTGKNKIADRFIQLLNREREYMQLHRDTTVDELTVRQALYEGQLVWEDSPLVKAALSGHILLLDEADKAPLEVVHILKNLIEYRQMLLPDGRRLIPHRQYTELLKHYDETKLRERGIFPIHPDFRMIILANRPGFPFLGNDFYRELGDLLSAHVIDNPPATSELAMLNKYAPGVPDEILEKLIAAFNDLRELFKQGGIPYPYSTRELVAVAKHLQKFPDDPIDMVLKNVLSFDEATRGEEIVGLLLQPFVFHGLIAGAVERSSDLVLAKREPLPAVERDLWPIQDSGVIDFQSGEIKIGKFTDLQVEKGNFTPKDERVKKFGEQILSWKIPSEGYVDLKTLSDGRISTLNKQGGMWLLTVWDLKRRSYKAAKFDEHSLHVARMAVLPDNRALININGLSIIDLDNFKIAKVQLGGLNTSEKQISVSQCGENPYRIVFCILSGESIDYTAGIADFTPGIGAFSGFNIEHYVNWFVFLNAQTLCYRADNDIFILNIEKGRELHKRKIIIPDSKRQRGYLFLLAYMLNKISFINNDSGVLFDLIFSDDKSALNAPVSYLSLSDKSYCGLWLKNGIRILEGNNGLIVLDPNDNTIRKIDIDLEDDERLIRDRGFSDIEELPDGKIATIQKHGKIRIWEPDENKVKADFEEEKRKREAGKRKLELKMTPKKGQPREKIIYDLPPVPGIIDADGGMHIGGGLYRGGTGGFRTAGLGGVGGPWREKGPAGQPVVRRPERESVELSPEAAVEQERIRAEHLAKELKELETSGSGEGQEEYYKYMQAVSKEIEALRAILENLDFKGHETIWERRRIDGELDDDRIVDGLTGARDVYKRRKRQEKRMAAAEKKKRIYFAIDISASMYRYNWNDGRLDKAKALAVMIMEAFAGYEDRYDYAIYGHSGDSPAIPLVQFGRPPGPEQRFKIIKEIGIRASHARTGDNTLEAAYIAMERVTEEDADDYFVFLVSDANLERYGIKPKHLGSILTGKENVKGYAIFIAGGSEAEEIVSILPSGRGKVALETKDLPKIFKDFFTRDVLKGTPAALLKYMYENNIFSDNPKKSKEMAGQRDGKDSLSTIKRELKVLRAVGLVKGDGRNGYYLSDWLRNIKYKTVIRQVPELNMPNPRAKIKEIKRKIRLLQNLAQAELIKEARKPGRALIFRKGNLIKVCRAISEGELKNLDNVIIRKRINARGYLIIGGNKKKACFEKYTNYPVDIYVKNGVITEVRILRNTKRLIDANRELKEGRYEFSLIYNGEGGLIDSYYYSLRELRLKKMGRCFIKRRFDRKGKLKIGGREWIVKPEYAGNPVKAEFIDGVLVKVVIFSKSRFLINADKVLKKGEIELNLIYRNGKLIDSYSKGVGRKQLFKLGTVTIKTKLDKYGHLHMCRKTKATFKKYGRHPVEVDVKKGVITEARILEKSKSLLDAKEIVKRGEKEFSIIFNEKGFPVDSYYAQFSENKFGKLKSHIVITRLDKLGTLVIGSKYKAQFAEHPNSIIAVKVKKGIIMEVDLLKIKKIRDFEMIWFNNGSIIKKKIPFKMVLDKKGNLIGSFYSPIYIPVRFRKHIGRITGEFNIDKYNGFIHKGKCYFFGDNVDYRGCAITSIIFSDEENPGEITGFVIYDKKTNKHITIDAKSVLQEYQPLGLAIEAIFLKEGRMKPKMLIGPMTITPQEAIIMKEKIKVVMDTLSKLLKGKQAKLELVLDALLLLYHGMDINKVAVELEIDREWLEGIISELKDAIRKYEDTVEREAKGKGPQKHPKPAPVGTDNSHIEITRKEIETAA